MPSDRKGCIERADEPCLHCFHGYALHLQLHCVECDRPMCPLCAVSVRRRSAIVCLECATESAGVA